MEFDIIGPEGAALQFDGKYGRSVRFKDGTEYVIEVTNKIYAHYAVATLGSDFFCARATCVEINQ